MRPYRIFVPKREWDGDWVYTCNLLLAVVESVVGRAVVLTHSPSESDLTVLNVFDLRDMLLRSRRSRGTRSLWSKPDRQRSGSEGALDEILAQEGLRGRTIVQAFENLDRPQWAEVGNLLRKSYVPRTTFWPSELDGNGTRVPYWWNYVRWPELPRPRAQYQRFGCLYELDALLRPLDRDAVMLKPNRAVLVAANLEFPRDAFVREVSRHVAIDVLGGRVGASPPKIEILRKYRYVLVPENSLGFGYCTEKVPEAWIGNCVPLGVIQQHASDWAHLGFTLNPDVALSFDSPLLLKRPSLDELMAYVARVLE